MANYFIRRFLLIPFTFIGITMLCFLVTRYVPGGPVEQAVLRYQQAQSTSGEGGVEVRHQWKAKDRSQRR